MNFAALKALPLVFVINNNAWAISVPRARQTAAETLAQKAVAAGMPGVQVDGNDVIAVRHAVGAAIERARRENKPIFLSVGYSTCYWCHVMEREAFSDPEVAAMMNRWFVNIKVDREERPDLDEIYIRRRNLLFHIG